MMEFSIRGSEFKNVHIAGVETIQFNESAIYHWLTRSPNPGVTESGYAGVIRCALDFTSNAETSEDDGSG